MTVSETMSVAIRQQNIFRKLSCAGAFEEVAYFHYLCLCQKVLSAVPCLNKVKAEGSFNITEAESGSLQFQSRMFKLWFLKGTYIKHVLQWSFSSQ